MNDSILCRCSRLPPQQRPSIIIGCQPRKAAATARVSKHLAHGAALHGEIIIVRIIMVQHNLLQVRQISSGSMLLDRWRGRVGRGPPRLRHGPPLCVCVCVSVGGNPPNQSESWQFNYTEIRGHSSFNQAAVRPHKGRKLLTWYSWEKMLRRVDGGRLEQIKEGQS